MWKLTRLLCHNQHDKARMSHNFASDTLTKVYRDAVYTPQARHQTHPLFPEWGAADASGDVTNHVGNLGVMSARAAALRAEADARPAHASRVDSDTADDDVPAHTASTSSAGRPSRPVVPPFQHMSTAPTAAASAVTARATPSAIERLRGSKHRSEAPSCAAAGAKTSTAAGPGTVRHSGVQREILSLYRQSLRETRRMRDVQTQKNLQAFIRTEYAKNMDIPRKHITKIEWHINHAKRKLEDLQAMSPSTRFSIYQ